MAAVSLVFPVEVGAERVGVAVNNGSRRPQAAIVHAAIGRGDF